MGRLQKSHVTRGAGFFVVASVLFVLVGGPFDQATAQQQAACDFLSGAGRISTTKGSGVASFSLASGVRQGAFAGHLAYVDSDLTLTVESTKITKYLSTGPTTRVIEGTARTNLYGDRSFRVTVTDNEKAGQNDAFQLELDNGYFSQGVLLSGSVALLKGNRNSKPPSGFTCDKFTTATQKGQAQ